MIKKSILGLGLYIVSVVILLGQVTVGSYIGMPVIWVLGCIIGLFCLYVYIFLDGQNQLMVGLVTAITVKIYLIALMFYYLYIFVSHLFN